MGQSKRLFEYWCKITVGRENHLFGLWTEPIQWPIHFYVNCAHLNGVAQLLENEGKTPSTKLFSWMALDSLALRKSPSFLLESCHASSNNLEFGLAIVHRSTHLIPKWSFARATVFHWFWMTFYLFHIAFLSWAIISRSSHIGIVVGDKRSHIISFCVFGPIQDNFWYLSLIFSGVCKTRDCSVRTSKTHK